MDDLRRLFRRAVLSATLNEGVPGLLGRHDGTLAYTDAQGRTHRDRCWARIGNGDATTEIVVRSSGVPRQYNLPVIIANRGGVPTAIHVDHQRAAQFSAGYLAEVPSHAWTHSRYGLDPLYVPGQQVLQLMAYPTSSASMAVTVAQGFYRWEGVSKVWEVGNSPDLSAFVPTDPSTQHFIVLCLDRANNALAVVDGTDAVAEPTAIPFDAGDVAALSIPLAYYPICAIRFYTGQTSILPYDIFMDLRLWGGEGQTGLATSEEPWAGEAPVWDGTQWVPTDVATQAELDTHAGDANGHHAQEHALFGPDHIDVAITSAPEDGQALIWDAAEARWVPGAVTVETHVHVYQEDHSAACDGARTEFTTVEPFDIGTTRVWLNGLLQQPGVSADYVEGGDGRTFRFAAAPKAGDSLLVAYIRRPASALTPSGPYTALTGSESAYLVQLHAHTTESDGSLSPADLASAYAAAGFDALAITDHDKVTSQSSGIATAVAGNELSPSTGHILSLFSTYTRGTETDQQAIIDGIVPAGGLAVLAHPRWSVGHSYANMAARNGYTGIEIHNAHCVDGAGENPITYPGFDLADWDALLTNVRRTIWGFSVDDFHADGLTDRVGAGRLQVFAATNTEAAIKAALQAGDFVADVSNDGVTPGIPAITSQGISLTCPGATAIRFIGDNGVLLKQNNGESGAYKFTGNETYVRIEAVGDYTEGFDNELDNRWAATGGTWSVNNGILEQTTNATGPFWLVLRRHILGDIEITCDLRTAASTDVARQCGILFNFLDTNNTYYLQLQPEPRNSDLGMNWWKWVGGVSTEIVKYGFAATDNTWYSVRMRFTASAGRLQARIWTTGSEEPTIWHIDAIDTALANGGAIGLRSRRPSAFDNLYINGFKTYYQPIPVGDWT